MKIIQSISGGMDSTCLLLHHLARRREVNLISFDYGQKHKLELERLDRNIDYIGGVLSQEPDLIECSFTHRRLPIPFGKLVNSALTQPDAAVPEGHYADANMKATVVPNRNMIFFSFVYALAVSKRGETPTDEDVAISLGVHAGDHEIYPDCRREFFEAAMEAGRIGNWIDGEIGFDLPYIDMDKEAILRGALVDCEALGLDFDTVLANTNTSYAPDAAGRANGKTGSDVERILAFHAIGRRDPVEYVEGWDSALGYALEQEEKFLATQSQS